MPVTASGPMSLPLQRIAELIAGCTSFQTAVGAANATEALTSCFYPECIENDPENPAPLNKAIITDSDVCSWEMSASLGQRGSLLVTFTFEADAELDPRSPEALLTFTNTVGAICFEMHNKANTPKGDGSNYWNLIRLSRLVAPDLDDSRKKTSTDTDEREPWVFEITLIAEYV